ncbi:unnamed protein product [Protopolystoma xenopodis]|uniref:Bcl-2 Bcl-2 homology region 1-3 domain-containing protein n=1 Tax=Protopolystoma xenopodis TaxID=117903 RepID=A0A448XHU4_9PLAT|nr:unnamed protein product [Protopolystoma xenopodis]
MPRGTLGARFNCICARNFSFIPFGEEAEVEEEVVAAVSEQVIRKLTEIADDMEERYGNLINDQANSWLSSGDFDTFVDIAKGPITWSRIVVLFMFATKIIANAIAKHIGDLAQMIVSHVVKFLFIHGILGWVRKRGGWLAVLYEYHPATSATGCIAFFSLLACVTLATMMVKKG